MENKLRYSLGLVAMLFLSPPLWALTDAEVEARLDQYAAKIKALEAELANAKQTPVYEQDVGKSSGKLEKQIQQIKDKMSADDQRFKVNGFMTAAVSKSDSEIGTAYNIGKKESFLGDSKMGLQFNYRMDNKVDATVQLLARSRGQSFGNSTDSWSVAAEWAYLGYQLTDDVKVRMGHLRIPFYMNSETLDVGYSYPWVRPPMEMYTTVITAYNGADALYKFSTGSVNHTLQFFTGGSSNPNSVSTGADKELNVRVKDLYGLNLTSGVGSWTARLMVATIKISGDIGVRTDTVLPAAGVDISALYSLPPGSVFTPGLDQPAAANLATLAAGGLQFDSCDLDSITGAYCLGGGYLRKSENDVFNYYSGGLQYDDGSLFVIAEAARLQTLNASLFSDGVQGYVTTGYRVGSWTPYYTYAEAYDTETTSHLAANFMKPTMMKSNSFGVRNEITPSLSAKFEYNHFYNLENDGGFGGSPGNNADIYTFALDAVF